AHLVVFGAFGDDPDHALAQVGARDGSLGEAEGLGLGAARTGGDAQVGDAVVGDVVADHLHALGIAEEGVAFHHRHLALFLGDLLQCADIELVADAAAGADVGGILGGGGGGRGVHYAASVDAVLWIT